MNKVQSELNRIRRGVLNSVLGDIRKKQNEISVSFFEENETIIFERVGNRKVDVSGKIKSLVVKKLKEVVEQLEEEFGMMFFGKKVELKGRNVKKNKKVKAVGIVSEVNVYVSEDLEVKLKVKFKKAGKVYEDINYITVFDTMPSKKRQSNNPLYHI